MILLLESAYKMKQQQDLKYLSLKLLTVWKTSYKKQRQYIAVEAAIKNEFIKLFAATTLLLCAGEKILHNGK